MLESLRKYVYDRRRTFSTFVGIASGLYMVGRYVADRFEEIREQVLQERQAKDNLRRRFQQNQEDISYIIMSLLPSLSNHVLEEMDVEGLILQLQSKAKAKKRAETPEPPPSDSSLASSVELLQGHDARSDGGSMSVVSTSGVEDDTRSSHIEASASSQSWVDEFSMRESALAMPSKPATDIGSPHSSREAYLSDSVTSESVVSTSDVERSRTLRVERGEPESGPSVTKSKAELWKEVKLLTFTRTLTIIYSMTLLSLLTHIQLSLLGRSKYVQSVIQLQREERSREHREYESSISALFWGSSSKQIDSEEIHFDDIHEGTEMKFLSLSWWLLHVGWKDVSERVRRSVQEVFDNVSLKGSIGSMELHRLVMDVRRRVEHEITYEGTERKINFLSTLIPPTPEILQHILIQGGVSPSMANSKDPAFVSLLDETRAIVASPTFSQVLEVCLDRATDVLFDGLQKNVFADENAAGPSEDSTTLGGETKVRLAELLPGLARWSHLALNGFPNELIDGLASVREMTGFAAYIYSSYDNILR
ncbi:hypothetical protein BD410DRAFT_781743 [Rickenella mellea]|uniref:Peroxin-3 n=1 Tax=Rickenella mellea TaxID=50990 RepID=A0A4Y7QK91_9AGAM|nr:hypothetical protein BD410DRAFT_781743 [Rickenella mellea]